MVAVARTCPLDRKKLLFLAARTESVAEKKVTTSTSLEGPKEGTYNKTRISTNPSEEACVCIYYSARVSNLHAATRALITLGIVCTSITVMYH